MTGQTPVLFSVIIPALNEEMMISKQIPHLRSVTSGLPLEIVVADNGSTDNTMEAALKAGADEVIAVSGTIGRARNQAVQRGRGKVLVFLDADIFPHSDWAEMLNAISDDVLGSRLLTGATYGVPPNGTWIERYWFMPDHLKPKKYINSGHLIMSRTLFDELGGFDEHLRTGEDVELSARAVSNGAVVRDDSNLRVVHEGFPKTLRQFAKRELWHGTGDFQSMALFRKSKVAMAGTAVVHLLLSALTASLVTGNPWWLIGATATVLFLSIIASIRKVRNASPLTRLYTSALFVVYFCARGLSLYLSSFRKISSGHRR